MSSMDRQLFVGKISVLGLLKYSEAFMFTFGDGMLLK